MISSFSSLQPFIKMIDVGKKFDILKNQIV